VGVECTSRRRRLRSGPPSRCLAPCIENSFLLVRLERQEAEEEMRREGEGRTRSEKQFTTAKRTCRRPCNGRCGRGQTEECSIEIDRAPRENQPKLKKKTAAMKIMCAAFLQMPKGRWLRAAKTSSLPFNEKSLDSLVPCYAKRINLHYIDILPPYLSNSLVSLVLERSGICIEEIMFMKGVLIPAGLRLFKKEDRRQIQLSYPLRPQNGDGSFDCGYSFNKSLNIVAPNPCKRGEHGDHG